jgi:hypothetical protein
MRDRVGFWVFVSQFRRWPIPGKAIKPAVFVGVEAKNTQVEETSK